MLLVVTRRPAMPRKASTTARAWRSSPAIMSSTTSGGWRRNQAASSASVSRSPMTRCTEAGGAPECSPMDDRDFVLRRQARDHVGANESGAADDDDPHSSYCNAGG